MYTLYILHIWHIGYLGQSPLSDIFYSHDIFDILQRLVTIGKKRGIYIYCETQPSSIQRLSSIIFPCLSSFVVVRTSRMVTSPLYDVLDHTNHTFSESYWSKDIKTDISKCLMHKYTNTSTQIHKSNWEVWKFHLTYDAKIFSLFLFSCVHVRKVESPIKLTDPRSWSLSGSLCPNKE